MKKFSKYIVVCIVVMLVIVQPVMNVNASQKSNIRKVLKYYKAGNLKKAKKYNKKIKKKASNKYIKKMSSEMKAVYKKKVKSFRLDAGLTGKKELWGYYLADMDGDKKPELLIHYGSCEADVKLIVYKYKKGKVKKVGSVAAGHSYFCAYPGHKGIIAVWGHMGYEGVSTLQLKKGKIKVVSYGEYDLNSKGTGDIDWFPFKQVLDGHMKWDSNYNKSLDLKDLS